MPHVAVVGAGVAGLAAAVALRRDGPDGLTVTVVDGAREAGGKLRTSELGGIPVEEGAESFLLAGDVAAAFAAQVGLGGEVVHPATASAALSVGGRLRPLPAGTFLGVPGRAWPLLRSGVLGPGDVARVAAERWARGPARDGDVAVGEVVAARLGRAVVERLVDPLLGGVYAGRAAELSLDATMPALSAAVHGGRSLTRTVRGLVGRPTGAPVFGGVRGGAGRLAAAASRAAGAELVLGRPVRELVRRADGGWSLLHGSRADAAALDADAVVLAVPAGPASRLLATACPEAAGELAGVGYASVALVALVLSGAAVPRYSGYLVPAREGRPVKAVTFLSTKWPWVAQAAGGDLVVRCSFGRYRETAVLQQPDEALVEAALRELREHAGVGVGAVRATRVTRWGGALPQYVVGHVDRVARVRTSVAALRTLAVCGAAYDGVGIPACVRSGTAAAVQVLAALR